MASQENPGSILSGPATAATESAQESTSRCKGDRSPARTGVAMRLAPERNPSWMLALAALLLAATGAQAQSIFATPQPVTTTSGPQTVTVTAQVAGTVNKVEVLTLGVSDLDFAAGAGASNCGSATLALNGTCTESVTFTPAYPGLRVGAVVLLDINSNVLGTAYLSGTGLGGLGVLVPGNVITVAGAYRQWTSTQDGIPATSANLDQPSSITFDGAGNMYIADSAHNRIRMVAAPIPPAVAGIISTIAGTGVAGSTGDNGPATASTLSAPSGLALDGAGNLYIADTGNNRVRKIAAATGIITTVAGNGAPGTPTNVGDGGAATSAELNQPWGATVDSSGNLFIADTSDQRIRRVDAVTGIITTVAGNGDPSGVGDGKGTYSGDGGLATKAGLSLPYAVAFDASGNMYIPDSANNRIRMVAEVNGIISASSIISTVAGTGSAGISCADGQALAVALNTPSGVALDPAGNLYIADTQDSCIRKTNSTTGNVTAIAVNNANAISPAGTLGYVEVYAPIGLFLDGSGDVYFADFYYMLIEEIQSNKAVLDYTKTPVQVGNQSPAQTRTVENDGNGALDLTAFTPGLNAGVDLGATTCSLTTPLTVDSDCLIAAVFAPSLTLVFPTGVTSEQVDANVDVYGNTVNFPLDTEDFPLDIILVGDATPVNATTLTLTSSRNPSNFGQSVTFTATVTSGATAGTPAGTVTFMDGATTLAAAVVLNSSGVATYQTAALAVGSHTIKASFTSATTANYLPSSATVIQIVDEVTATNLTSSLNPSAVGQNVTFTALVTISGGGGVTPDGTVTFTDTTTGTILGSQTLGPSGIVTVSTAALTQGLHAITAAYGGDAANDILGSTSAVLNQDVQASGAIQLASNPNPSTYGTPIVFTVTVSTVGTVAATGKVSILAAGQATPIATVTLAGNPATGTATISTLAVGTYTVTASYPGDSNYAQSTSQPITQVVSPAQTSTTVNAVPNPGIAGTAVAVTATVKLTAGVATPTGTVTFTDTFNGATVTLGKPALGTAGTATINPATLAPGIHSIVATYSGDANDNGSASAPYALTVNPATTSATVTATPNPALVQATITFTAKVTGNGGTPTGSVKFYANATTLLGAANLDATGTATITYAGLAAGSYQITAVYAGDPNDSGTTSPAITEVVGTISTITDLGASTTTGANPQVILVATVLNNATTSTGAAATPTPTGTVTFNNGTTAIGSATLDSSGVATLVPNLVAGTSYTIVAVYSGDALHSPSTSPAVTISGTATDFTLTVTPAKVTLAKSQNTTLTVTLASSSGFTDTIGLGCASLPAGVTCHFSSLNVALAANSTGTAQLTIDTNNPLGGGASAMVAHPGNRGVSLAGFLLPFSVLFGCVFWRFRRRYAFVLTSALVLLLSGAAMLVTGCAGITQSSAAPGTYVIQVVGVGANSDITHYQNVTLTITQ
jgi:hypothetical protein